MASDDLSFTHILDIRMGEDRMDQYELKAGDYVEWHRDTHWDGVTGERLRGVVVGRTDIPDCDVPVMPVIRTLYGDYHELPRNVKVLKSGIYVKTLLVAALLLCVAGCGHVHAQGNSGVQLYGCGTLGVSPVPCPITPESRDVPPKEVPGEVVGHGDCKANDDGTFTCPKEYRNPSSYECEDKSRFLLQSQDGKEHCLKLTP